MINNLLKLSKAIGRASILGVVTVLGGVALLVSPDDAEAGCKSCYGAGYASADICCNFAITSAFATVNGAIVASEHTLLEAMGMGTNMALGTVGFPGLQTTVEVSEGQATKTIVDTIELMAKHLTMEQRRLPAAQQAIKAERERGAAAVTFPDITGANARMGQALGAGGGNSAPAITQFLMSTSGKLLYGDALRSQLPNSEAPAGLPTREEVQASLPRDVVNRAKASQAQLFQELEAWAEEHDKVLYEELNAGILIDKEHVTIKSPEDESSDLSSGQMPTSDKLDIVVQLLTDSRPEGFQALEQGARSITALNLASEGKVRYMRQSIVAGILGRTTNMRRAHKGSLGGEKYIKEALGEELDGPISDEEFMELLATRRVKDPKLIAINAVSSRIAAQDLAQMEAEHLYIKYQRYLAKRDTNLALAQILASQTRAESEAQGVRD